MQLSKVLSGGNARSLGRTQEVVELVLSDRNLLSELFDCLYQPDEIIRMRASDALEKVCRQKPEWSKPYKNQLLYEVSEIKQASVQWHLAQILSEISLNDTEKRRAVSILKNNLATSDDWIVINLSLESLAVFVRGKAFGRQQFIDILKTQRQSQYKSVVSRANKLLKEFSDG